MKRKIATRKLSRTCTQCNCGFKKGDVYYIQRNVYDDVEEIVTAEFLYCPRCKFEMEDHERRHERFKPNCLHPLVDEIWSYIPGEAVMQPDHDACRICGKWV